MKKKIIQQKKIIKPEEYKSKVEALRNKVSKLQAQKVNFGKHCQSKKYSKERTFEKSKSYN